MKSSNPAFNNKAFSQAATSGATMTISGTINRAFILLLLLVVSAVFTWTRAHSSPDVALFGVAGAIGGLVLGLVTCFVARISPFTAPVYAICEGLFLGFISALMEAKFKGIVFDTVMLTGGTLFCLLGAYRFGLIRATEGFKAGVFAAMGAIVLLYLVSFVLHLFGQTIPYIHDNGPIGICFSLFVVVVAALNLIIDFDFIEQGEANGAPKYMEWYGAFGLMVTLIWLYLRILRLLSKLRSR